MKSAKHSINLNNVSAEIADIAKPPRPALVARWIEVFGSPPPKGLSRRLVAYALAYHAQEIAFGGLSASALKTLNRVATPKTNEGDEDRRNKDRKATPPGTRLIRGWHGKTYTVDVAEDGFVYAGTTYRSLSEIARVITGTRWSGPRFFGL